MLLRKKLSRLGLRYRLHTAELPGKPDIVFRSARVAVFCDGDFWHGRDWSELQGKLQRRANPEYWVRKIRYNRERDVLNTRALRDQGWLVLRFWETDILGDVDVLGEQVLAIVRARLSQKQL